MTTRIPTGFCVCVAEGHPELCPNTPGRCAFKCSEYSAGKIKPAYPVPAIIYQVEMFPEVTFIFEMTLIEEFITEGNCVYVYHA